MYKSVDIFLHAYIDRCTYIYIDTHIHIHTYIHTYMYIRVCVCVSCSVSLSLFLSLFYSRFCEYLSVCVLLRLCLCECVVAFAP